jgi:hypothetical protein
VREDVRVTLYHRENNLVFGGTTNQTRCWGVVFLRGKLQGTLEGTGLSVELWTSSDEKLTTLNGIASSAKLSVARQTQNEGYPVALAVTR